MALSRLDVPRIIEAVERLYRTLENLNAEPPWLADALAETGQSLDGSPCGAPLFVCLARDVVRRRIAPSESDADIEQSKLSDDCKLALVALLHRLRQDYRPLIENAQENRNYRRFLSEVLTALRNEVAIGRGTRFITGTTPDVIGGLTNSESQLAAIGWPPNMLPYHAALQWRTEPPADGDWLGWYKRAAEFSNTTAHIEIRRERNQALRSDLSTLAEYKPADHQAVMRYAARLSGEPQTEQAKGADETPAVMPAAASVKPSELRYYNMYKYAISEAPYLDGDGSRAVYNWLEQHLDEEVFGKLPSYNTFKSAISRARAAGNEPVNNPRAGRTGRSIVRRSELDG